MANFLLSTESAVIVYISVCTLIAAGLAFWRSRPKNPMQKYLKISFLPLELKDQILCAVLIVICGAAWIWTIFFPLDFGHLDEIAHLTGTIGGIEAQIFMGRFFPIAHWEFNILSPSLYGGDLAPLYALPLGQFIIFILCLDYLLRPGSLIFRAFAIGSACWLAAFMPMVHLIIPERNVFFFILIGLCLMKSYAMQPRPWTAALAVSAMSLALYYKEPVFAFVLPIACVFVFYAFLDMYKKCQSFIYTVCKAFGPIELSLILSCVFFLVGYVLFVYSDAPQEIYMDVTAKATLTEYIMRFWYYLLNLPILSLLFLSALGAHVLIPQGAFDRALAAGVAMGGAGYLSVMVVLNITLNGYYYAPPLLAMCLSVGIVTKHALIAWCQKKHFVPLLTLCILIGGMSFVLYAHSPEIAEDVLKKKNYHNYYAFLRKEISKAKNVHTIYYAHNDKVHEDFLSFSKRFQPNINSNFFRFINTLSTYDSFVLFTKYGCHIAYQSENNGRTSCIQKAYNPWDTYDLIIIDDNTVPLSHHLENGRIVRHEDPYPRLDGSYGSLTLIFRSSDNTLQTP